MGLDYENDGALHAKLIEDVLSQYPDKAAKRRLSVWCLRFSTGIITVALRSWAAEAGRAC
ncbi:hypothetical protein BFX40_10250 [Mesorhizobium sp. SEMIA 3007]|nr:hypothetical protein BFX40_10250 [Mesorhizobium sp. SEMIA 3007]